MWKKLGVVLLSFVGTFSVVYALNKEISATTVNEYETKPFNMNLGNTVFWTSPEGTPIEWKVIANGFDNNVAPDTELTLHSYRSLGTLNFSSMALNGIGQQYGRNGLRTFVTSKFNETTLPIESPYIIPVQTVNTSTNIALEEVLPNGSPLDYAYVLSATEAFINRSVDTNSSHGGYIEGSYSTPYNSYYFPDKKSRSTTSTNMPAILRTKATRSISATISLYGASGIEGVMGDGSGLGQDFAVYPAMRLKQEKFALATPLSDATGITTTGINGASKLGNVLSNMQMKIALRHDTANINISNANAIPSSLIDTHTIKVDYNLQGGSSGAGKYINAVLAKKDTNTGMETSYLIGRVKEVTSMGNGSIDLDLSNAETGNYILRLYYEEVNDGVVNYNLASSVSNGVSIEVVNPLSISYAAAPQSGATVANTYEYSKNVAPGTKVGSLTYENGAGTPTFSIIADPNAPAGHENDYNNFELTTNPTSSPVDVKIKASGAPDVANGYLKANNYYFRITGVDENGDPNPAKYIDVSLEVKKTKPTISFTTATKKELKIGDESFADTVTTTNTDTLASGDITYELSGGISNVLTVSANPDVVLGYKLNVAATYTGTSLPTDTFKLKATVKETDNYLEASTTSETNRPIYVYKALSGLKWSASKDTYSSSDVVSGSTVGTLKAADGVGPYTYALTSSADGDNYVAADAANNGSFTIASGTDVAAGTAVDVTTNTSLSFGTYKIQFKVTDAKGDVSYQKATIVVNATAQDTVFFTDADGVNNITSTGITIAYDDTNKKLIATGGSTTEDMEYYLAEQSEQDDEIDPTTILTVGQSDGKLTPQGVGKVKVYAKRPGNASYGDATSAAMYVTVKKAEQSLAFNNTASPVYIRKGVTGTDLSALGKITSTNATGIGGITYTSSDSTKVSVDSDGKISGLLAGEVIITATLNAEASSSYNVNYETKVAQKRVTVYEGMTLTWSASTPNLKAGSSVVGTVAGTVSATNNFGAVTFAKSTDTGSLDNADAEYFNVAQNGTVQLARAITAADLVTHGSNEYKIKVTAVDTHLDPVELNLTIQIDNETNTSKFTKQDGTEITSLSKVYGEDENKFQLYTSTSNGGDVTYQLNPEDTSGILSVDETTGLVTINKVGTGSTSVQAVVSSGSGYDGITISLPVSITAGTQTIAFTGTSQNHEFVQDGQFRDPAEGAQAVLKETSANRVSDRDISYSSTTTSVCTIDTEGTITMLSAGNCTVKAFNSDANWQAASATKTITLFSGMGVSFTQSNTPKANTGTALVDSSVGSLSAAGGHGNKSYSVSVSTEASNKDASFFKVSDSGIVSLNDEITAEDIRGCFYNPELKAYIMHVQFVATDDLGNTATTDAEIKIEGAPLNAQFSGVVNGKISKPYVPNGTFALSLASNEGRGVPTYRIKDDGVHPTDVLQSVSADGLATIGNANDRTANSNPVIVEAEIPANGGYEAKTIEVEVEIVKASQPDFKFKTSTIELPINARVSPEIDGKLSSGTVTLRSSNPTALKVEGNEIVSDTLEETVTITASDSGDRNYKTATNTASVTITSEPPYVFIISVPTATYGDTGLSASIEENIEAENQVRVWESSNPSIADVDENGNLTIHKAGRVEIKCTQTVEGIPGSVTSEATFIVKPKPITITINDAVRYVGEERSEYYMTIPEGVLVGDDTLGSPIFSCVDSSNLEVGPFTMPGTYDIKASFPSESNSNYSIVVRPGKLTVKQDSFSASQFHMEGVTSNETINPTNWQNQDIRLILDTAVESAGTYDEFSVDRVQWSKNSIIINREGETSWDVYYRISAGSASHPLAITHPQSVKFKIDKTKPVIKNITGTTTNKDAISTLLNKLTFGAYFKPGTKVSIKSEDLIPSSGMKVSGVKSVAYEIFEVDRTTGRIGSTAIARGELTPNGSGISEVTLNDTGLYRVCATPTDNAGNQGVVSCSDLNVKNIGVDVDGDGELDNLDPDNDGCPDINIVLKDEEDEYYHINVDRNEDKLPDLNIDSDGDGIADINVDTDEDGKPDLNLLIITKEMWKPTYCVTGQSDDTAGNAEEYCTTKELIPVINVDTDDDFIPNINIDTNGDMKADFNITKVNETEPYLNIGKVHETWLPDKDYGSLETFLFDSDERGKPLYNIDSDGDGLPDINIDLDHDGNADINIDLNGDGIPDLDIDGDGDGIPDFSLDDGTGNPGNNKLILGEWKPSINGEKDGTSFNTMEIKKKDVLEDSGVTVEKPGGVFLPNFAIKVKDVTNEVENEVKDAIGKVLNDKDVKNIYDVSLWKDNIQVQPDGTLRVKVPYDTSLKNPKVIIEMEDGTFKEVDAKIEDGFLVYDSNYLGKIGIVDDKEVVDPSPNPTPEEEVKTPVTENKTPTTVTDVPTTSVKGTYVNGMGGALTGDSTSIMGWITILVSSAIIVYLLRTFYQKSSKK